MKPLRFLRVFVAMTVVCCLGMGVLTGCSEERASDEAVSHGNGFAPVRIGTMPTEDFLPMWVAEKDGMFADAGVEVETITFDSAQTLSSAIASGEVDMAMVDVMRALKLCESGTSVDIEWVTLGATPEEGVFGVLAPAEASYSTLSELADAVAVGDELASKGIGVAANTVPEYVFEKLCEQEGVDPSAIPAQEVASLPERYSLMASGNLAAAALPASLLELGKASGMKLLADDSEGDNVSQSVMVARSTFAAENAGAIMKVAEAWDRAAKAIDANPEAYMVLLADKANLNSAVIDTYEISSYPFATVDGELVYIDEQLVLPQAEWMREKGYLSGDIGFDPSAGTVTVS